MCLSASRLSASSCKRHRCEGAGRSLSWSRVGGASYVSSAGGWDGREAVPPSCLSFARHIFTDKSNIDSKNPPHEFTNKWITRRQYRVRAFCARPHSATDKTRSSARRNSSRTHVVERAGSYHCRRTEYLDVAALLATRGLTLNLNVEIMDPGEIIASGSPFLDSQFRRRTPGIAFDTDRVLYSSAC